MIGHHVDDLICCGEGEVYQERLDLLRSAFPFGSWKDAQRESIMFCGCEMRQKADGTIILNQERYACGITEVQLSQARRYEKDQQLTPEERRQFRAVLGALSWRATQSAPWLCASVSYLQGTYSTATVEELCLLNKLVRLQRQYCEVPLQFQAGISRPILVTFCDASWASRKDGSSQGGMLTLLADAAILDGEVSGFAPVSWQSRKLRVSPGRPHPLRCRCVVRVPIPTSLLNKFSCSILKRSKPITSTMP